MRRGAVICSKFCAALFNQSTNSLAYRVSQFMTSNMASSRGVFLVPLRTLAHGPTQHQQQSQVTENRPECDGEMWLAVHVAILQRTSIKLRYPQYPLSQAHSLACHAPERCAMQPIQADEACQLMSRGLLESRCCLCMHLCTSAASAVS